MQSMFTNLISPWLQKRKLSAISKISFAIKWQGCTGKVSHPHVLPSFHGDLFGGNTSYDHFKYNPVTAQNHLQNGKLRTFRAGIHDWIFIMRIKPLIDLRNPVHSQAQKAAANRDIFQSALRVFKMWRFKQMKSFRFWPHVSSFTQQTSEDILRNVHVYTEIIDTYSSGLPMMLWHICDHHHVSRVKCLDLVSNFWLCFDFLVSVFVFHVFFTFSITALTVLDQ